MCKLVIVAAAAVLQAVSADPSPLSIIEGWCFYATKGECQEGFTCRRIGRNDSRTPLYTCVDDTWNTECGQGTYGTCPAGQACTRYDEPSNIWPEILHWRCERPTGRSQCRRRQFGFCPTGQECQVTDQGRNNGDDLYKCVPVEPVDPVCGGAVDGTCPNADQECVQDYPGHYQCQDIPIDTCGPTFGTCVDGFDCVETGWGTGEFACVESTSTPPPATCYPECSAGEECQESSKGSFECVAVEIDACGPGFGACADGLKCQEKQYLPGEFECVDPHVPVEPVEPECGGRTFGTCPANQFCDKRTRRNGKTFFRCRPEQKQYPQCRGTTYGRCRNGNECAVIGRTHTFPPQWLFGCNPDRHV